MTFCRDENIFIFTLIPSVSEGRNIRIDEHVWKSSNEDGITQKNKQKKISQIKLVAKNFGEDVEHWLMPDN